MATFKATDLNTKAVHVGPFGEASLPAGKVTLTAFAAADKVQICKIAAGTEVHGIILANDDIDSSGTPTAAFKLGYEPVDTAAGPAASDAYFGATGDTALQAVNNGKLYANFDPIKFEQDVFLILTATASAATFAAGSVRAKALVRNIGVK